MKKALKNKLNELGYEIFKDPFRKEIHAVHFIKVNKNYIYINIIIVGNKIIDSYVRPDDSYHFCSTRDANKLKVQCKKLQNDLEVLKECEEKCNLN